MKKWICGNLARLLRMKRPHRKFVSKSIKCDVNSLFDPLKPKYRGSDQFESLIVNPEQINLKKLNKTKENDEIIALSY